MKLALTGCVQFGAVPTSEQQYGAQFLGCWGCGGAGKPFRLHFGDSVVNVAY